MPRYLSAEWFASAVSSGDGPVDLVLEQVVTGTPDGTVMYRVEVAAGRAWIVWPVQPDQPPADLRITSDWPTAVAVAQGQLSTQRALMQGRLRVRGRPDRLAVPGAGVDAVPEDVRSATTYS